MATPVGLFADVRRTSEPMSNPAQTYLNVHRCEPPRSRRVPETTYITTVPFVPGTVYFSFGLPCGRVVISRPSFLVAVVAHVSSPNGEPRLTLRRMAASSASK